RRAVIHRSPLVAIAAREILVLHLNRRRRSMRITQGDALLRGGLARDPTRATVEADARSRRLCDALRVDVVHGRHVHVVDGGVVIERVAPPVAAGVADAEVAEPVVDAAVEPYVRTPVAGMPEVRAT